MNRIICASTAALALMLGNAEAAEHSMQGMDHIQMPGMDHGAMHPAPAAPPARPTTPVASRTPVPALTDADRAAVYRAPGGHQVHDDAINTYLLLNRLEWQDADAGSALAWDAKGWVGGDIDRLWLRSEGERLGGTTRRAEAQALWGHAVSPVWDVLAGVRQDFKPGAAQTWVAFGVQGTPLYNLEVEATAFLGEGGQAAARLEAEYDLLLTQRLILQPNAEVNLQTDNDPARAQGAGLANTEAGVRLRYEIRPQFAPYLGISWHRAYGNSARFTEADGEDRSEARLVMGVRLWF